MAKCATSVYCDQQVEALVLARQGMQDAGRICHACALRGSAADDLCHRGIGGSAFRLTCRGLLVAPVLDRPRCYIISLLGDRLMGYAINGKRPTTLVTVCSCIEKSVVSPYFSMKLVKVPIS